MRHLITATCLHLALFSSLSGISTCVHAEQLVGTPAEKRSTASSAPEPIATLMSESGSVIYFLDLGEGRAGVAEQAGASEPLIVDLLVQQWRATPLEMFLALAPNARAPDLLVRDHSATTPSAPRRLQVPTAHGVPIDIFDCDPPENFEQDWHDTYEDVTQIVVSESYYDFPWEQFDWWPGIHAYNGTNHNQATHFGLCNGDQNASFSVSVDRRTTYSVNGVQQVSWSHKVTASFSYMGRFTFHTNLPGIYRMRLFDPSELPITQVSAGAAYTMSPPVGIEE